MEKLTIRQVIMISEKQKESLNKLAEYDVNISQFIRSAIKEKINKEWKSIKESQIKDECPF